MLTYRGNEGATVAGNRATGWVTGGGGHQIPCFFDSSKACQIPDLEQVPGEDLRPIMHWITPD